jgi:hypothetical protein
MYAQIMGIVRHILTFAGGALVALGVTTSVDWSAVLTNFDAVTGGIVAIAAFVASVWSKVSASGGIGGFIKSLLGATTPDAKL